MRFDLELQSGSRSNMCHHFVTATNWIYLILFQLRIRPSWVTALITIDGQKGVSLKRYQCTRMMTVHTADPLDIDPAIQMKLVKTIAYQRRRGVGRRDGKISKSSTAVGFVT
ncbi:uncharacterized protein YALI1_A15523g [Yarrowia lipolytica]|uniref:Uncharacterized protein n=1 Tax=Yarrowia lipolytica TaxID=4952 RepID=A0A1D8N4Y5_YARLL|nr:hypothetical protein YALI1_A15523g [Yarrowia lipolytica]